ncbi:MAG: NUDIX domain-containing protein [SAR202 cluster bacterium]|nr:NUDIX domain-containing protein [SAR202 cluster bacterium]|tara:strand:- start:1629 stop:2090 length:462 start_codon:yes stop_codon:yes gene_type:complete
MNSNTNTENHFSYGGVVYDNKTHQIIICGWAHGAEWLWGLPKGTPDVGESNEETAIREVTEETGLHVSISHFVDSINYSFIRTSDNVLCHKTVGFYLMNAIGGSIEDHDAEFDQVKWVVPEEAAKMLVHENEINVVYKAMDIIGKSIRHEKLN